MNAAAIPAGFGSREGPFTWTVAGVREALGLSAVSAPGDGERTFAGVSTDTRTLTPGALFLALEGPTFDGHDFLLQAAEAGARGAVVRQLPRGVAGALGPDFVFFPVPDTLEALGALAHYRRLRLPARVVALTGSSGKTTTKELLRAALSPALRVHATEANLNNRVGVPLTLLQAPEDAEVVVVEVGTSEPGEIAALRKVAHPDVAVVVTVGPSHVEGLGGMEGIWQEKLSLLEQLPSHAAIVVGDEPPELAERARTLAPTHALTVAGLSDWADQPWRGRLLEADADGRWRVGLPGGSVTVPVPGAHGARCALVALAVADRVGVSLEVAREGLAHARLPGFRSQVRRLPGGTLLVDCYNANPQSTRAALAWLASLPSEGPRIAVLGSMLELGPSGPDHHRRILAELAGGTGGRAGDQAPHPPAGERTPAGEPGPVAVVVAVGDFARAAAALPRTHSPSQGAAAEGTPVTRPAPRILPVEEVDGIIDALRPHLAPGATLLLKGSRGVALERILPALEALLGAPAPGRTPSTGPGGV